MITFRGGKYPSHRRAPNAGVHISNKPWGVLDKAKKSFKR
jgi:hypothetical protein